MNSTQRGKSSVKVVTHSKPHRSCAAGKTVSKKVFARNTVSQHPNGKKGNK